MMEERGEKRAGKRVAKRQEEIRVLVCGATSLGLEEAQAGREEVGADQIGLL